MKAGSESFYPFPRAWFLSCCLSCFIGSLVGFYCHRISQISEGIISVGRYFAVVLFLSGV
jgi:hypothetical protein